MTKKSGKRLDYRNILLISNTKRKISRKNLYQKMIKIGFLKMIYLSTLVIFSQETTQLKVLLGRFESFSLIKTILLIKLDMTLSIQQRDMLLG